jgi:hypothetical protein
VPSVSSSSSGATRSTATRASPYLPRPWFTLAKPKPSWPTVKSCSMPPTKPIRTASFSGHRNRCHCLQRFGSTSRHRPAIRQQKVVTKLPCWVSQMLDTRRRSKRSLQPPGLSKAETPNPLRRFIRSRLQRPQMGPIFKAAPGFQETRRGLPSRAERYAATAQDSHDEREFKGGEIDSLTDNPSDAQTDLYLNLAC